MAKGTTKTFNHGCPGKSKGGCRQASDGVYCSTHQRMCPNHPLKRCLKTELCGKCIGKEMMDQQRQRQQEQNERGNGGPSADTDDSSGRDKKDPKKNYKQ